MASGEEVTVRALLFIIAGHLEHHMNVLLKNTGDRFRNKIK